MDMKVVGLGMGLSMAMLPYDWPFADDWPEEAWDGPACDACDGVVMWAILLDVELDRGGRRHVDTLGDAYLLEGWRRRMGVGFDVPLSACPEPAGLGLDATDKELRAITRMLSSARSLAPLLAGCEDDMSLFLDDYYLHGGWLRWPTDGPKDDEWRAWRTVPRMDPDMFALRVAGTP